jgi:hypothetical protein
MISAAASTTHQEQAAHTSTWEVKLKMLQEFQASNNHVEVTQVDECQSADIQLGHK